VTVLLKNIAGVTVYPASIEKIDMRIQDGVIVEKGKSLRASLNDKVFDLGGKIVMPGFVNAHTHLYSTLSRGMPAPEKSPRNFLEILKSIWWKLDEALDEETIYYSALIGAIEAVKCGTTTIVDRHASPNAIGGSLDIIQQALYDVGMRGVLCYEVTDRGGKKKRDAGLAENERFIWKSKDNDYFKGVVGAHASLTLSDESLKLCGAMAKENNTGVHIHVAEEECDVVDAKNKYHSTIVERLMKYGILSDRTILAHCIHLQEKEYKSLQHSNCWFAHNPRSNMNNKVGYAPVHQFKNRGMIGTDGFPSDLLEEAKIAFFKRQDSRNKQNVDYGSLVTGGQRMISHIFDKTFGSLNKGSVADLVVMDYAPPTTMKPDNLIGHYLFGMRSSNVESVMIGGRWVVKNRKISGVDMERAYSEAQSKSKKMWIKMMETVP
jgi:putative selenium metabolism protein SsnA